MHKKSKTSIYRFLIQIFLKNDTSMLRIRQKFKRRQTRTSAHRSHGDLMRFMKRNPLTYQRNTRDCRTCETREKTHDYRSPNRQAALLKTPPVIRLGAMENAVFSSRDELCYIFARSEPTNSEDSCLRKDPRRSSSSRERVTTRAPVIHYYDAQSTLCETDAKSRDTPSLNV